jgi:hypothetical protein
MAVLGGNAMAASLEAMQGAWTMDGTDCSETFKTVDGRPAFTDRSSSLDSGMIISGDKVTNANAVCTIGRSHPDGDKVTVTLRCEDSIMFSDMSVTFRVLDDKTIERYDPIFSDVLATYHKCS